MADIPYPNNQNNPAGAIPVWVAPAPAGAAVGITPKAATASVIATGGTFVTVVTGPILGGYLLNPPNAASQGVTAETLYVDPVAHPGSTDGTANGTTSALVAGATYTIPALAAGHSLFANAATTGHKFTVVVW